uniref:(northern house mosquito) hypothetical protein n=1 Tax=Culex pipiens TaxID=7175 RepID=A0A8D8N038_CULPI
MFLTCAGRQKKRAVCLDKQGLVWLKDVDVMIPQCGHIDVNGSVIMHPLKILAATTTARKVLPTGKFFEVLSGRAQPAKYYELIQAEDITKLLGPVFVMTEGWRACSRRLISDRMLEKDRASSGLHGEGNVRNRRSLMWSLVSPERSLSDSSQLTLVERYEQEKTSTQTKKWSTIAARGRQVCRFGSRFLPSPQE